MLTILGDGQTATCQGPTRRELLHIGGLGLGGLALSHLFTPQARAAARSVVRDKAVVLLFLQGGPPQIETWDPKPEADDTVRSCTGWVGTKLPGVCFGGTFGRLAARADRLAIVRSFASTDGGHNQLPVLTGRNAFAAPMGSVYSRGIGPLHPRTGVPSNVVLVPESVQPDLKLGEPTGPFTYGYVQKNYVPAGRLGSRYDAFIPGGGAELFRNLRLQLPRDQFDNRRELLSRLDSLRHDLDRAGDLTGAEAAQRTAYDVLLRGVADAFDLSRESQRTIARYDTSHVFRMEDYHRGGKYYNNLRNQSRMTNLLGKQLLLARRLCEAGCGFVTVVDGGWDFHGDGNNPPTPIGMPVMGTQVDHAVSAFLDDVQDRGLSEKILLIITGEMGRTSRKGRNGGTNHNGNITPLLLAGGGLKMGQVIGQSDRIGNAPATPRYTPENLLASVLHTLFDAGELRITPAALPAAVSKMVLEGQPIRELFA